MWRRGKRGEEVREGERKGKQDGVREREMSPTPRGNRGQKVTMIPVIPFKNFLLIIFLF